MSFGFDAFKARVCAKLNLSLAITGTRGNLHTLDMIVCPCDEFADEAYFVPDDSQTEAKLTLLDVSADFDGFDPFRFQKFFLPKLDKIAKYFDVCGDLAIKKGVPLGAGLGGSSAATVAVLKAVEQYLSSTGKPRPVSSDFLLSLGSDIPCMYIGGVCRVQGVGDVVTPLPCEPPKAKIFIPNCSSDSAECYALYDKLVAQGKLTPPSAVPATLDEALVGLRNDLELPAATLHPEIGDLLAALRSQYDRVIMSGSGSACACILR